MIDELELDFLKEEGTLDNRVRRFKRTEDSQLCDILAKMMQAKKRKINQRGEE